MMLKNGKESSRMAFDDGSRLRLATGEHALRTAFQPNVPVEIRIDSSMTAIFPKSLMG